MKKVVSAIVFALISLTASAGQLDPKPVQYCEQFTPYGSPVDSLKNTTKVCRTAYYLEHDNQAKIPVWVSYTLEPAHTIGCVKRTNKFAPDFSLNKGERAELNDYRNSGYDKGHIANDADMTWSSVTEKESLILSNMTPQLHSLNAGPWKDLETEVRDWSYNRRHTLLIYAGPIYNSSDKTIGDNKVVVPYSFYKIVVDTATKETMAFVFPHSSVDNDLTKYLVSVGEVERLTGVSFPVPSVKNKVASLWRMEKSSASAEKKNVCAK